MNFSDPTGLSQAGNPLNNLFGGGYAGGIVGPEPKPINLNPNLLASPTLNYNSASSPYAYGPTSKSHNNTLYGLGNVAQSAVTSALTTFNPLATTVVNTGLGIGAATFLTKPPTVDPSVRHAYDQLGPIDKIAGFFFSDLGYQYDTNAALNRQQQAADPNRTLRAGDMGTALGDSSQYAATGQGIVTIKEFGRERVRDISAEAAMAGTGAVLGVVLKKLDNANDLRKANKYLKGQIPIAGTRSTGVARAMVLEVELIQKTGKGTTNWTAKEIAYIKRTGQLPDNIVGHHINSVAQHPEWAGDPRNIEFVRGQQENLAKHGGKFQNPTTGPLIDRQELIQPTGRRK